MNPEDQSATAIAVQVGLWIGFKLLIGAAYVLAAWYAHRRAGVPGLALTWLGAAVIYGYMTYRYTCAQPLTCDVGGPEATWHYLSRLVPIYSLVGAVAFGAGSLIVLHRHRKEPQSSIRPRDVVVGAIAIFVGWFVISVVMSALRLPSY